ncbi:hypothetical protein U5922_012950 [Aquicoccus sp. G2-2]
MLAVSSSAMRAAMGMASAMLMPVLRRGS